MGRPALIVALVVAAGALAAVGFTATGTQRLRPLPLKAGAALPSPLLAVASTATGSKLEQIDPSTFAPVRSSTPVDWYDGWVISPGHKRLAVAVHADGNYATSTIRFATASTLSWTDKGVELDGYFRGGLWPRPDILYALVGNCCGPGLTLETVNTATKKVVAKTKLGALAGTVARSAAGLVVLGTQVNKLVASAAERHRLERPRPLDNPRQDHQRHPLRPDEPGPDRHHPTARPGCRRQRRHRLRRRSQRTDRRGAPQRPRRHLPPARSVADRPALCLAHPAGAGKGTQRAGADRTLARRRPDRRRRNHQHDDEEQGRRASPTRLHRQGCGSSTPTTGASTPSTTQGEQMLVGDGLLLSSGGSWRSATNSSSSAASGEGLVAYGPDGSVRWRLDPGKDINLLGAWGSRALIQAYGSTVQPVQLVDLDSHRDHPQLRSEQLSLAAHRRRLIARSDRPSSRR